MDPKTKQLVKEAEARAKKATEGPWSEVCHELGGCDCGYICANARDGMLCEVFRTSSKGVDFSSYSDTQAHRNADFIAHARTDVPAICAAVREQDNRARHAEQERDALDKRIAELEAQCENIELEHAASWFAFEKEALDALGPEVIGTTVDAGADIPGMIKKLHERYRVEIQRERSRRIEAEEQLTTYKRIANIKRKK